MTITELVRQQDMETEFQMRLDLRAVLFQALALLTDPDAEPADADRVTDAIIKILEDTAP